MSTIRRGRGMQHLAWGLLLLAVVFIAGCGAAPAPRATQAVVASTPIPMAAVTAPFAKAEPDIYTCGGAVETATWQLWDTQGRAFLRDQLLGGRLIGRGDTYALYDLQTYFHNLQAMAQRCDRAHRLIEMADELIVAFGALEPLHNNPADVAWICKGGAVCNTRNRLVNTEVMLVSEQGLGLMTALANALASSGDPVARAHPFIARTAQVSAAHLLRWGDDKAQQEWQRLTTAKATDVKNGSSALFFTDKPLWQIAIYANLAGIYAAQPALYEGFIANAEQRQQLTQSIRTLLPFFKARITQKTVANPVLGRVNVAEIDRGYERLYGDNRYAGYTGAAKPAICAEGVGDAKAQLLVDAKSTPVVTGLGWDISHARRLVHALSALQQNRAAMQKIYGLNADELLAPGTEKEFAAQLVATIWNGDLQAPLFTNYWSGANGWYRVAYDNGTGYCNEGYPPFGLSDSFATGGYATWVRYEPVIGDIARRIFALSKNKTEAGKKYTQLYMRGLALSATASTRMVTQLMFWPTLVK